MYLNFVGRDLVHSTFSSSNILTNVINLSVFVAAEYTSFVKINIEGGGGERGKGDHRWIC